MPKNAVRRIDLLSAPAAPLIAYIARPFQHGAILARYTCRPKLDASRYARLNDEATPPEDVTTWLDKCLILSQQTIMPYVIYKALAGTREEEKVTDYARFVGPSVASRMVLVL